MLTTITRLTLICSIVLAGVVHAWLASGRPWLAPAIALAFAVSALVSRVSLVGALVPVLAATYFAPAITYVAFGASDYHTTAIWLAALAGPVIVHSDPTRWHLPRRWAFPFVAWALVIAVSWPIVAGREVDFSFVAARTYDTTTSAFGAPPRLAAAWIVIVALSQMLGILWLDLLWARFSGSRLRQAERWIIRPLVVSACIGAAAGLYQALIDLEWLNLPVWIHGARAGGLMLDANSFGMSAAMWAPIGVALSWRSDRARWAGPAAYALLASAVLWAAGSRTALLALIIGTAGLLVGFARRRGVWSGQVVVAAVVLSAVLAGLAVALAPQLDQSNPVRRVVDRLPNPRAGELRRFLDEMWTRYGYGTAAAAMTADHPLTGVGIGGFHIVAADYMFREKPFFLPTPDNAQNWWRHQLAELGLLGALPSWWISALLIAAVWQGTRGTEPTANVLSAGLAGVGAASLLGVPTQLPAIWIAFITLTFWLLALPGPNAPNVEQERRSWVWAAACVLAAVVALGQAITARADLRVPHRAMRSGLTFGYGLSPSEGLSEFGELRWSAGRALEVLRVGNRWLRITVWAPHPDIASRPVTLNVAVNDRRVVTYTLNTSQPVTYYVATPDARFALLEMEVSREMRPDRALQVATAWLPEPPATAPSTQIIR